jgi:predicted DCC family thiol-disulfide oxidoreductase YuxK
LSGAKGILAFDGACGFCRRQAERWLGRIGERADLVPFQQCMDRFPEIPRSAWESAVHLIEPDGRVLTGARAILRVLASTPRAARVLDLAERVPGLLPLVERIYRFAARHRHRL